MSIGRRIRLRGTVQGVGIRPWIYRLASGLDLRGRVRNDEGGVTIEVFGPPRQLDRFERELGSGRPVAARLTEPTSEPLEVAAARIPPRFEIADSEIGLERRPSIPADLATCDACLAELFDPGDRRYGHPFINCTDCGPRYTVAREVPYDRARTSMADFAMCPACLAEYEDPHSRRFHAQPIACPDCGPRLSFCDSDARDRPVRSPLAAAARALAAGRIVAVKGLGGFHLACDARSPAAVARLRARKRREARPFAVMVRDLAAARRIAESSDVEAALLCGPERPIVLLPRRRDAGRDAPCDEVAPGSPLLGVLLAYTPLHHLLLHEGPDCLVMTSGNLSNEPMVIRNDEAIRKLEGVADVFLLHDREIAARCDDSVARSVAGAPLVLRRARGWVPRPIPLAKPVAEPVLAVGAHLKNAACLAVGDTAWLGPHVGDLESLEAIDAFEETIERLQHFVGVRADLVAHDLHPDYHSTRYARALPQVRTHAVQHHHAHLASALAEHGLEGPALGLVWDGTGLGTDGSAWGGELLLADRTGFRRLASFRPLPLAGGENAIREVWRLALAALEDAYGGDPPLDSLALFADVDPDRMRLVRQVLAAGTLGLPAHGVGRWFDAIGALVLARGVARYEGEIALAWNLAAGAAAAEPYPFEIATALRGAGAIEEVDLRPLVRATVDDLGAGIPARVISGRFHATLAAAGAALVRQAVRRLGSHPVALSGGCFQNALLAELLVAALQPDHRVLMHGEVPPGDGGLALGQAWVAAAGAVEGSKSCA